MYKLDRKQFINKMSNDINKTAEEFNDAKKLAFVDSQNQTHNAKKEALGPNTKR